MAEPNEAEIFEFSLQVADSEIDEEELYRRLQEALRGATEAIGQEEESRINAKAEVRGAFDGLGGIGVMLVIAFLSGAAKKVGEKSGEHFYAKYLEPRLKKLNLIPRNFRKHVSKKGGKS